MGCVCGKLSRGVKDRRGGQKKRELAKGSSAVGTEREESFRVKEKSENGDIRVGSFDTKPNGSKRVGDDHYEKVNGVEAIVPKAMEGELIAAGWPSSLAAVAGEAINGWIPRKADTFEKLDKVEQLHKIFKLCGSPTEDYWRKTKLSYSAVFKPIQPYKRRIGERFKELPPSAVGLLETLLSIDPALRGTAVGALESEFFTTKPFACDPSSLPTYPPSKEIDAKLREEEARRQGNANGSKERQAAPAHDANAKLASSMQRRQSGSNSKSQSDRFNPPKEAAARFPNDQPKASQAAKQTTKDHLENLSDRFSVKNHLDDISETFSHRVPLALGVFGKKYDDISIGPDRADLSDLVASRSIVSGDDRNRCVQQNYSGSHQFESGRASKEANLHDHGYKGNEIHYSGSLLVASSKVDQMLKDRDRHLQEAARRARFEKA